MLLIKVLRPKQWYKNVVIFVGIIFSNNIFNLSIYLDALLAFLIFCAISSSVYIINDIVDIAKDREHPIKSLRPLASGKLDIFSALVLSFLLMLISFLTSYIVNIFLFFTVSTYFVLNLLYSFSLKKYMILDVLLISFFFILRAIAGCVVISVSISPWLIACTFQLALILAIGKRNDELTLMGSLGKETRTSLNSYSADILDYMFTVVSATLIMSYGMYTFLAPNLYLMFTNLFSIYGVFRYSYLLKNGSFKGEPDSFLKDIPSLINFSLWFIFTFLIIYIIT